MISLKERFECTEYEMLEDGKKIKLLGHDISRRKVCVGDKDQEISVSQEEYVEKRVGY